jgi:hypothetical protein
VLKGDKFGHGEAAWLMMLHIGAPQ